MPPPTAACGLNDMQDKREHRGHLVDVHEDDDECDKEIDARHDRHEQCGERCDTLDTAKDDCTRKDGEDRPHDVGINAERLLHRERDRVCLHRDVDQTERD